MVILFFIFTFNSSYISPLFVKLKKKKIVAPKKKKMKKKMKIRMVSFDSKVHVGFLTAKAYQKRRRPVQLGHLRQSGFWSSF